MGPSSIPLVSHSILPHSHSVSHTHTPLSLFFPSTVIFFHSALSLITTIESQASTMFTSNTPRRESNTSCIENWHCCQLVPKLSQPVYSKIHQRKITIKVQQKPHRSPKQRVWSEKEIHGRGRRS